MENFTEQKGPLGLYRPPGSSHDACGIGAVVDIKGRKSHQTVSDALSIVERLSTAPARTPGRNAQRFEYPGPRAAPPRWTAI